MKKTITAVSTIILFIFLTLSTTANAAWTPAPSSPPNGNVDAPVNIGSSYQPKSGPLRAGQLFGSGWNYLNNKSFISNGSGGDNRSALIFGATDNPESWFFGQLDNNQTVAKDAFTLWSWASGWVQTWLPNGNVGIGTTAPTAKLEVDGQVMIKDGSQGAGKILTSDANGLASWQNVAPTQSVSCNNVNNSSFISLNGNNSGNNNGIVVNLGTLNTGTYTFSGSGQTYNSGGGGYAGVIIDSRSSLTYTQANSKLSPIPITGGAPNTGASDSTYKWYYNTDNKDIIAVLKRNGYNDSTFTIPSTSITISGTSYIYLVLGQSAISGSITVGGSQKVCGGGGGASGVSKIIAGTGITVSPSSGTGDVTVSSTGGASISSVRDSLEYKSCYVNSRLQGAVYCISQCSTGKKIVSGSCVVENPTSSYVTDSRPSTDSTGWYCGVYNEPSYNTSVRALGTGVCL